jgi:hypothetical protein
MYTEYIIRLLTTILGATRSTVRRPPSYNTVVKWKPKYHVGGKFRSISEIQ